MRYLALVFSFVLSSHFGWSQCDLSFNLDSIPASCNGNCDGSIGVSFTNSGDPAAPYVAIFQNSLGSTVGSYTFFNESDSYIFNGVCAGMYTVTIQSIPDPSCSYSGLVEVIEPSPLVIASVSVVNETSGMSNGSISLVGSGGISPYLYSINSGTTYQGSSNFSSLTAGTYDVLVQDANGCTSAQTVGLGLITSSGCEVVAELLTTPATCYGLCDGELQIDYQNLQVISPGSPYTFSLENSDGIIVGTQTNAAESQSLLFAGLCPDNYSLTISGTTCTFEISAEIETPDPLAIYANITDPVFGANNGTIELVGAGGVPGYNFSIDGGLSFQASPLFNTLASGSYAGVIEDANGCQGSMNVVLSDQTDCLLALSLSNVINPICFGECSGSISFDFSDSFMNGTYVVNLISGGQVIASQSFNSISETGVFSNLCAGNYTVELVNNLACSVEQTVLISNPSQLLVSNISTTNSVAGGSTGSATITANGGQAPYSYSLNGTDFTTNPSFSNLVSGFYLAYVQDAAGCTALLDFVINEGDACNNDVDLIVTHPTCSGTCDGSVQLDITGNVGDAPYYIELHMAGFLVDAVVETAHIASADFANLCSGHATFKIYNSDGCLRFASALINEPQDLNLFVNTTDATSGVNNGEIELSAIGGNMPYSYSINNQTTWQTSPLFQNLPADTYSVWVEDANGCQAQLNTQLNESDNCNSIIQLISTNTTCPVNCDGTIAVTFLDVLNNPPYQIYLYQGVQLIDTSLVYNTFSGYFQFTDLCAGPYTVSVVDQNGCADNQEVFIHGAELIQVTDVVINSPDAGTSSGTAELLVEGGTAPYEFAINDDYIWQNSNYYTDLSAGMYTVMVKDANECVFIHVFTVNEEPGCTINTVYQLDPAASCYDSCDAVINYGFSEAVNNGPYFLQLIYNSGVIESQTIATNNFSGIWDSLCWGTYSMSVENADGCMAIMPSLTITLPPQLNIEASVTDAMPGQDNGSVDLFANGGTGQHTFSLDGFDFQVESEFENLSPGSYLAYVMDDYGCSDTIYFDVVENPNCDIALTTVSDALLTCPGDCNGAISFEYLDASSNMPYATILYSQSGEILASSTSASVNGNGLFTDLCAGSYHVVTLNAAGCQSVPADITILEPESIVIDIDPVLPFDNYYNGSITLNPTGGTAPYEYSTNQTSWSSVNTYSGLNANFYIFYVMDANGCEQVYGYSLHNAYVTALLEESNDFVVFPNPSQGEFYVRGSGIQSIVVYDAGGRLLPLDISQTGEIVPIDLSAFSDGVYLVEILNASGAIERARIVKH